MMATAWLEAGSTRPTHLSEAANAVDSYFRNAAAEAAAAATSTPRPAVGGGFAPLGRTKGTGTAPARFFESGELLLEAARGLLAGLGSLQRAMDQCTRYLAVSRERRLVPSVETALCEVQRRTLGLVRTLERADAAHTQLLASSHAAKIPPTLPSSAATVDLVPWTAERDQLVEAAAAATTAHRSLLKELMPQLDALTGTLDARGLRCVLLNVHGAVTEFAAAWNALSVLLVDPETSQQTVKRGSAESGPPAPMGEASQSVADRPLYTPRAQATPDDRSPLRQQVFFQPPLTAGTVPGTPGVTASVAAASTVLEPQPGNAESAFMAQSGQRLAQVPNSRFCMAAEVATVIALNALNILGDAVAEDGLEPHDKLRNFSNQVSVARHTVDRLTGALQVYATKSPTNLVTAGSSVNHGGKESAMALLDSAEAFVKAVIHLISLAKHISLERKDKFNRAAVSAISALTRTTKDLAMALQDLSSVAPASLQVSSSPAANTVAPLESAAMPTESAMNPLESVMTPLGSAMLSPAETR